MLSILTFDPGESTGWCFRDRDGVVTGGTLPRDHLVVAEAISTRKPDIVVFERFNLYPQMAKSLAWSSFYPCEVIGVIKYKCAQMSIPIVEQAPGVKKYSGGYKSDWEQVKSTPGFKLTEHVKDAYQHLKYFERNGLKKFEAAQ